ncbi:MAG: Na/Pi cotransporter family protein [Spirochaetaceae bacterium]|jgi:phosphate:Na+ symporter|nr:Na/Pi cotransporter family protein [Spirochaetaceae bacterium]
MEILGILLRIAGSLGLFLYGMKVMGDGIQQGAGERLQRALGFMTGNRFSAIATGLTVTAIIQSSSATTVMVVSFVNAGLLTLKQAIGVIMGANIGTTVTAWIVSLIGFSLDISTIALPAVGVGFVMRTVKWKYQAAGDAVMGFGLLFLGIDFLTQSMPAIDADKLEFLRTFGSTSFPHILTFAGIGLVMTLIVHSSSASTAIMLTMAHNGIIDFNSAAAMVLGANIGTTIDALLASIGTKTVARRAAIVHVLFNVIGAVIALLFFNQLVALVRAISPGGASAPETTQIAMFHTTFNVLNTLLFLPFVKPFAALVTFLVKDTSKDASKGKPENVYQLSYLSSAIRDTPELSLLRAKTEIQKMTALVFSMYRKLWDSLQNLSSETTNALVAELREKEEYADQMREVLTSYLMECTRGQLNRHSRHNVSLLLRIIDDLEDMTDNCFSISLLLERSVRKDQIFKQKEMAELDPYMGLVEEFLSFIKERVGGKLNPEQTLYAKRIEENIDQSRNKLRKLGRKRIEEGEDVKTELLFIDLVRRIEKLGDYCYSISNSMGQMNV